MKPIKQATGARPVGSAIPERQRWALYEQQKRAWLQANPRADDRAVGEAFRGIAERLGL